MVAIPSRVLGGAMGMVGTTMGALAGLSPQGWGVTPMCLHLGWVIAGIHAAEYSHIAFIRYLYLDTFETDSVHITYRKGRSL